MYRKHNRFKYCFACQCEGLYLFQTMRHEFSFGVPSVTSIRLDVTFYSTLPHASNYYLQVEYINYENEEM